MLTYMRQVTLLPLRKGTMCMQKEHQCRQATFLDKQHLQEGQVSCDITQRGMFLQ